MKKLAVTTDNTLKTASNGCPKCGKKPEEHGKVILCKSRDCGTEPFEARKDCTEET